MDRRRFLRSSVAAAVAGLIGPAAGFASGLGNGFAFGARRPLDRIGLQLYTVRSLMANDVEGTLSLVAAIGYSEVEFAGLFDRSPRQVRKTLDGLGLTAPATHLGIGVFRDGLDEAIEAGHTLGHRFLILPSLPRSAFASTDAVRRIAEEMNGFGERCRTAGLRFGFHNHATELGQVEGEVPLRLLLEHTDPALVTFEVDLFWMVDGGGDPLAYFAAYPGRFELCHVKDRTASGEMVDVGAGVIDFPAIFARARRAGLEHYFVEHDDPKDPADSVATSFHYLRSLREAAGKRSSVAS